MPTLDRYLAANIARGCLVVLLLLVAVFSFLDLVEELEEVGRGHYTAADALAFVVLTMPGRALDLSPIIVLLGCLFGLGALHRHQEVLAMRAAGVSVRRLGLSVMKTGVLIALAVALAAEFVVPRLDAHGWRERALALSGGVAVSTEQGSGFWFRDRQRFINVRDMLYGQVPSDIDIFEFDGEGRLEVFTHAREAELGPGGQWLLKDVMRKHITSPGVEVRHHHTFPWKAYLSPQQGAVMALEADRLAPSDLYYYTRSLRARGQSAERYELALWRKLALPLASCAMVLLSIPFVFGALRLRSLGERVMVGAGVGVAFYLMDKVIAQTGLLVGLNPAITAMAPVLLVSGVGLWLMLHLR